MASSCKDISSILYKYWDPLGIGGIAPQDEYEEYAYRVCKILEESNDASRLCEYLDEVRREKLLAISNPSRDKEVVDRILASLGC